MIMRPLLANLGFLSQMAGIFMIIPIIASFIYQETPAIVALLITAMIFLILGFFLNSLCERKDLDYKSSNRLVFLSFVLLSLIGAIPYFMVNATGGGFAQRITDSVFESVSGYTTTGFSVIANPSLLPHSIVLYRALTQFIGGIGIILILMIFFYSEERLQNFSRTFGLEKNGNIKKTFILIALVYTGIVLFMGILAYLNGFKDINLLLSYLFSAVSGGGFSPVLDITSSVAGTSFGYILIATMIFGASNFLIVAGLFLFKFKAFIKSEVSVYIGLILASFLFVKFTFSLGYFDALFHVASAATNTGYQYMNTAIWSDSLKLFFIALMLVGGCSLSAAGGIKIYRLGIMFRAIGKSIYDNITLQDKKIKVFEKEYTNDEIVQNFVVIILIVGLTFLSAIILQTGGYGFVNSLFTTASAVATTGIDVGIVNSTLGLGFKWLISFLMLAGRVEVFAILIIFSRVKEK